MGLFNNLFGSSDTQYPTRYTGEVPPACGDAPYQPPEPGGILNQIFGGAQLPYPVPACYKASAQPGGGTMAGGSCTAPSTPATQTTGAQAAPTGPTTVAVGVQPSGAPASSSAPPVS